MHPGIFAAKEPDRPAVIMAAAGTVVELAERLGGYCRQHLAGFKCPRSFEFTHGELPPSAGA